MMSERNASRAGRLWGVAGIAVLAGLLGLGWWLVIARPAAERAERARATLAEARAALQANRPDRAARLVEDLDDDGPWRAELLALRGLVLAAYDRPQDARPLLEESLALDPEQPLVAKVLAAAYFSGSESDRGFAMLERAARLDPDDFRPWFAAGNILLRYHGRPADAARAYQEALRRQPDHPEARVGLVDALLAEQRTDEAGPVLDRLLAEQPEDARVTRLAARRARLLGDAEALARLSEQAVALDPVDPEARALRAQALQAEGRLDEALGHAERAVERAPNDPTALSLLAALEGALGLKERSALTAARHRAVLARTEAISRLKQEMAERPTDPEPRWRMGQLALEAGETTLARGSFQAALALDPACQPARQGLLALQRRSP